MGRSQVARNQRCGRPGTKGRGSTKGHATSNRNNLHSSTTLGDNSFRYQDSSDFSSGNIVGGGHEWCDTMSGSQYGPAHNSVEIHRIGIPTMERMGGNKSDQSKIDIDRLAAHLDRIENSSWMKLSSRMTCVFNERFREIEKNGKMTITEMNAVCDSSLASLTLKQLDMKRPNITPFKKEDCVNDGEEESEEEVLNDWIDSIIQT
mmetsp:Transcript_1135/g.1315  ORF Transcript_1135/g.1315 Transcript_1135/m.1315 type:complete len:205 (-) Transcript_1135:64-678(-)